jgi:hypothetical protein
MKWVTGYNNDIAWRWKIPVKRQINISYLKSFATSLAIQIGVKTAT